MTIRYVDPEGPRVSAWEGSMQRSAHGDDDRL